MESKLLDILDNLKKDEFERFKWFLKNPQSLKEGYKALKESKLENASQRDTVDLMVKAYTLKGAVTTTKKLLGMIPRNDLALELPDPEGQSHSRSNDGCAPEVGLLRGSSFLRVVEEDLRFDL